MQLGLWCISTMRNPHDVVYKGYALRPEGDDRCTDGFNHTNRSHYTLSHISALRPCYQTLFIILWTPKSHDADEAMTHS